MKPANRQMASSFTSGRRREYFTILGRGKPNSNIVNEKIRLRDGCVPSRSVSLQLLPVFRTFVEIWQSIILLSSPAPSLNILLDCWPTFSALVLLQRDNKASRRRVGQHLPLLQQCKHPWHLTAKMYKKCKYKLSINTWTLNTTHNTPTYPHQTHFWHETWIDTEDHQRSVRNHICGEVIFSNPTCSAAWKPAPVTDNKITPLGLKWERLEFIMIRVDPHLDLLGRRLSPKCTSSSARVDRVETE